MRWVKDDKVTANFRRLGIALDTERVPLNKIDLPEGLRRQSRLVGKLKDDTVLQYAEAMLQPDAAFPMTVLNKPPRGLMWAWSGNHRLAAFVLAYPDETEIEAYTCLVRDQMMMDVISRVVNAWEGMGLSTEEKIINTRWLIEKHGMKTDEACALFGLKTGAIYKANAAANVKQELVNLGIPVNGMSKTLMEKLNPLCENRNVLKATAKLIHDHKVGLDEAYTIIAEVRSQKTELQMTSELGRWEKVFIAREQSNRTKEHEVKKTRAVVTFKAATKEAFLRNLTGLDKVLGKADTLDKLQISDPVDMANAERSWKRVQKVMDAIMKGK